MKIINMPATKLQPDMKIYEDVFTEPGALILPKDTILDRAHITKLLINRIEKVKVIVEEENETGAGQLPNITSAYDNQKIASFRKKYSQKVEEITQVIKQIGRGATINMNYVKSISRQLVDEFRSMNDIVNYMNLVKPMNDLTYSHSLNVSLIGMVIAKWLSFNPQQMDEVAIAGLLHDIGKTKISDKILEKPGKLTAEEYEEVKKHAILGYMMVENLTDISSDIKYSVLMHHERIDGSGYPTNAKENQIPLYARIIAVADIYDAMTSRRSYRDSMCPFDVIKEFEMETFGKLDTLVLSVFLKNIANSYLGDFVELSNGEIAEIVFINPNRVWQPIVRSGSHFIDLSQRNEKLYIKQII
ncbi:MAG: metal dependent phosphohydrolase [Clostridia bacterium]|jgi:putative nucleotidyltransferase with HDIG domain|nr:metal dependent phosphohydrolase [Clostridia bacterium]